MGLIDVTELLSDPDFVDPVTIIKRSPTIDQFGDNTLSEQGFPTWGSVQSIDGKTLQRLPDQYRVANVKHFFVKGTIVSDGSCKYPDILVSNGVRYAVQVIFDWTNWGAGWCEGTCVQEKPTL